MTNAKLIDICKLSKLSNKIVYNDCDLLYTLIFLRIDKYEKCYTNKDTIIKRLIRFYNIIKNCKQNCNSIIKIQRYMKTYFLQYLLSLLACIHVSL